MILREAPVLSAEVAYLHSPQLAFGCKPQVVSFRRAVVEFYGSLENQPILEFALRQGGINLGDIIQATITVGAIIAVCSLLVWLGHTFMGPALFLLIMPIALQLWLSYLARGGGDLAVYAGKCMTDSERAALLDSVRIRSYLWTLLLLVLWFCMLNGLMGWLR